MLNILRPVYSVTAWFRGSRKIPKKEMFLRRQFVSSSWMLNRRSMTSRTGSSQNRALKTRFHFPKQTLNLPLCYQYLQGTETSHTLLLYETGQCKSEHSSPSLCRVCRSMWPNTEQKVPKKLKQNGVISLKIHTYRWSLSKGRSTLFNCTCTGHSLQRH